MLLHGIHPPITTPFYPEGNIYFKKLEQNVEHYSKTPVAGIVVLGSTGEAILLSDDERRDVLKTAVEAASPNKVMIAGTGIESASEIVVTVEAGENLIIDVVDNGVGIPAGTARSGLLGVERRAAKCGGTATVGRGPRGGTRLTWRVPLT